jgi:hypothetical protein
MLSDLFIYRKNKNSHPKGRILGARISGEELIREVQSQPWEASIGL